MVLFKEFFDAYSGSNCDLTVSELLPKLRYWFKDRPLEYCGLSCVAIDTAFHPVLVFRGGRQFFTFTLDFVCKTDVIRVLPKRAFEVEFNDILLPW